MSFNKHSLTPHPETALALPKRGKDFSDPCYNNIRKELPHPRVVTKFSMWDIIKDAVGKDINRFTMPGIINLNYISVAK